MHNIKPLALILLTSAFLWGCTADTPSGNSSNAVKSYSGELTKSEYDALTNEQKYQVANKLLGTMFKGVPVDEFFDISNGMDNKTLKSGANLLFDTKRALATDLTQANVIENDLIITDPDDDDNNSLFRLNFNDNSDDATWPKQLPLSRIYQYPLSKDTLDNWIAYVLANTILFSPAEEIDSTTVRDVQKVFDKLREDLRANKTVSQIISRHQRTQENWRRFRSPEDNTREMIEIYLGLFDRDADVPRASIACKNLYLTDENAGYELISNGFANTEPQYVLDTFVTTCGDFYDVVANHPLVMPRVTTSIVEYFFFTKTGEERAEIVAGILSDSPTTFQDIFVSILFNKDYLLNNERPKSVEETFYSLSHQMDWRPYRDVLEDMTSDLDELSLKQMGWPIMSLKLGRFTGVPLDSLSFANYHKGVREKLILGSTDSSCNDEDSNRSCRWSTGLGVNPSEADLTVPLADDATDQAKVMRQYEVNRMAKIEERTDRVTGLSLDDYIDYVFMTGLQRNASDIEKTDLITMYTTANYLVDDDGVMVIRDGRHDEMAQIALDYMTRLPEFYYYMKAN
ncbi:MAG: hypothetical protein OQK98_16385 [Gammaproteobacteria bacterium]|nr:hypothetical protein [Gammaproteobacteria bacterium]